MFNGRNTSLWNKKRKEKEYITKTIQKKVKQNINVRKEGVQRKKIIVVE